MEIEDFYWLSATKEYVEVLSIFRFKTTRVAPWFLQIRQVLPFKGENIKSLAPRYVFVIPFNIALFAVLASKHIHPLVSMPVTHRSRISLISLARQDLDITLFQMNLEDEMGIRQNYQPSVRDIHSFVQSPASNFQRFEHLISILFLIYPPRLEVIVIYQFRKWEREDSGCSEVIKRILMLPFTVQYAIVCAFKSKGNQFLIKLLWDALKHQNYILFQIWENHAKCIPMFANLRRRLDFLCLYFLTYPGGFFHLFIQGPEIFISFFAQELFFLESVFYLKMFHFLLKNI